VSVALSQQIAHTLFHANTPAHQAVCDGIVEQWTSGVQMLGRWVQGMRAR
jgi:hypothetical protein